ncbi:MAG: hypothetical protein R3325_12745 [Thermoanaerobaculia bacterium]|nr:hypothetical protein [Thermoanaerobaculia bacterium]
MRSATAPLLWAAAVALAGACGAAPPVASTLAALDRHLERHPALEAVDVYKFLHHSVMGPGHAIPDPEAARSWLDREIAGLGPPAPGEVLCEELGGEPEMARIHLRPYLARGGSPEALLEAFLASAEVEGDPRRLAALLGSAAERLRLRERPDLADGLAALTADMSAQGFPAIRHGDRFRERYRPAYRLVRAPLARERGWCDSQAARAPGGE